MKGKCLRDFLGLESHRKLTQILTEGGCHVLPLKDLQLQLCDYGFSRERKSKGTVESSFTVKGDCWTRCVTGKSMHGGLEKALPEACKVPAGCTEDYKILGMTEQWDSCQEQLLTGYGWYQSKREKCVAVSKAGRRVENPLNKNLEFSL